MAHHLSQGDLGAAEIDVDMLDDRLASERRSASSIYVSDMALGVIAHRPD